MPVKIDELLKKEKKVSKRRIQIEEEQKRKEEEEERIRLEKKRLFLEQLEAERIEAENRVVPICPVCNKILRKHSTYVDKEKGEVIHRDCSGVITQNLLRTHRGILKGVSK